MNKKIIYIILAVLLVGGLAFYFFQNNLISHKVDNYIQENLPENLSLTYDKVSTNIISGDLILTNPKLVIKDQGAEIYLSEFSILGLDYTKIFASDTLEIEETIFENARVIIDKSKKQKINKTKKDRKNLVIKLNEIIIGIANLESRDKDGVLNAKMDATTLNVNDLIIQTAPKDQQNYVKYQLSKLATDSLHLPLSKFQTLSIGHLLIDSTSLDLTDTRLVLKDQGVDINFDKLALEGAILNNLMGRDSLIFENCILKKGNIEINNAKKQTKAAKDSLHKANKFIGVKNFEIEDTNFALYNNKGKLAISFEHTNALFSDLEILTNPSAEQNAITYKFIELAADSLKVPLSLHTLTSKKIEADEKLFKATQLAIYPNYSREVFQTKLKEERDMITLSVPHLDIVDYDYSIDSNSPYLLASLVTLNQPDLNVYRNKYPPDQTPRKPLYSEMLREMNFELGIEKIELKQAKITYEEQKSFNRTSGKIWFQDLNANINHLYNKRPDKDKVMMEARTQFMGHAPTHVIWNFNIHQPADQFHFEGTINNLRGSSLDDFLAANMKAKIDGTVEKTVFSFDGADWGAKGKMEMDYEDIEVHILNKEHKKKGFWSAIANFFVKNDDNQRDKNYQIVAVERDQRKSFFNLLWLFLKQGLKQNMIKFQSADASK